MDINPILEGDFLTAGKMSGPDRTVIQPDCTASSFILSLSTNTDCYCGYITVKGCLLKTANMVSQRYLKSMYLYSGISAV